VSPLAWAFEQAASQTDAFMGGRSPRRTREGMPVSTLHRRILAAMTLACLLFASAEFAIPAAGKRDVSFQLFASRAAGWGFTNTTLSIPGPPMEVQVGDNVTLNLTSVDGRTHSWFIDYNNNSQYNAGEPRSTFFGTAVLWNFTVSNRTGTFRYRSDRGAGDLATMWGNLTVVPAGTLDGPLANPLVLGGLVAVFLAVIVVAVVIYRRGGKRPAP
jgi:hypothetical protein